MALYHEHRPQSFDMVLGQEHIVETIKNQIATGKVAHAYLFSGPRGVGKTTTARVLAKALNCKERKQGESEPCNTCSSCQEITASRAIDVIEIDAASHTGVDNVRENIIDNAQFKPTSSPYKIFIIDEVHMLSTSAFNALLKTLEEPPKHVVFILATTEMAKLPETIVSRCQRYQFKKISFTILTDHLKTIAKDKKITIDDDVLERMVKKSDGCARDAVSLLDQIMASGVRHITAAAAGSVLPISTSEEVVRFVSCCIKKDVKSGLTLLEDLHEQGTNISQFLTDVIDFLRSLLIKKINPVHIFSLDISKEMEGEVQAMLPTVSTGELLALLDIAMRRWKEVRSSPIPTLPAELLLFEWAETGTPTTAREVPPSSPPVVEKKTEEKIKIETTTATATAVKRDPASAVTGSRPNGGKIEIVNDVPVDQEKEIEIPDMLPTGAVSVDQVQKNWSTFMLAVEKMSPSLVFILKMADIKEIKGDTLLLGVQYTFHRDKILDKSCHKQLETLLSQTLNASLRLDVIVTSPITLEKNEEVQELATLLGGEVV